MILNKRPLQTLEEVKDAWADKEIPSLSEWAENNYILPKETAELSGPWSNEYVPFLQKPMEWLSDVGTRQVTVAACSQGAKTELGNIFIGRTVDVAPAPTMIVMPREVDAKRRIATRLRPMFKSTPTLLSHLGGNLEKLNTGKETVLDNMIFYIAWSNSPAALSDNPVCHIILDEVGKFPPSSGKEADPVSLSKKRQRTFRTRSKLLVLSTFVEEGDLFDAEFQKGDMNEFFVKCQLCGIYHIMANKNLIMDKTKSGKLLHPEKYKNGGHARYVCPFCQRPWSEYQRWDAVFSGVYAPAGCKVDRSGQIIGNMPVTSHHSCRISAFMLNPAFQTMDDLAADWANAMTEKKKRNVKPLHDYFNSQLAETWKETEKETDITPLLAHVGNYEQSKVPKGVQMISCGVDIQIDHIWVSVEGWGYLSEVWSIYEARLETGSTKELENWELLRRFLKTPWQSEDDNNKIPFYIYVTAIDTGYRPEVVKDFCSQCTELNLLQVRGDDSVRNRPFRASKIAGGLMIRYDLNLNSYKGRLYRLLFESKTPGPGYWHLHKETTEETLQHLTSEEQRPVRTKRKQSYELIWVLKKEHLPNHLWDCKVYSSFAAEISGAQSLQPLTNEPKVNESNQNKQGTGFLDDIPKLF